MRLAALLAVAALIACTPSVDEPDVDPDTEGEPDPRFDPATWPDSVGGDRPADVFAPSDYDGASLLPVVLMLHGYGGDAAAQDSYVFQLSDRVDPESFVLITPDGTMDSRGSRFWNATDACCDFFGTGVDDVGYLLGLLDEVEAAMPIDADRITVVGHSNGGFMSYRLACEASDRLAGIASLAGATYKNPAMCDADGPVSVLQIHGTLDGTISFYGNPFLPSARDSAQYWADVASCGTPSEAGRSDYEATVPGDETTRERWSDCEGTTQVELWTMTGGGHIPSFTEAARDDLTAWLLAQRR
jgi:polyhydroxybutyrate depolymerase